jgi:hypothetical protein
MLTTSTKKRLTNALTRQLLADEMEAALVSATPLSSKLKRAIEVAMANKAAAQSVIQAIETSNGQVLNLDAKRRIIQMMAQKTAGQELITAIESSN